MVSEIEAIRAFMSLDYYVALSVEIIESTNKRLCDDLYDAEIAYCEKARSAAKLSVSDLRLLLQQERAEFKEFCISYIKSERRLDLGQEYNSSGTGLLLENTDETYVGHSQTFLFSCAVLFFLLKHKRSQLAAFLKKIRKPNATEYQKVVESLFDALG